MGQSEARCFQNSLFTSILYRKKRKNPIFSFLIPIFGLYDRDMIAYRHIHTKIYAREREKSKRIWSSAPLSIAFALEGYEMSCFNSYWGCNSTRFSDGSLCRYMIAPDYSDRCSDDCWGWYMCDWWPPCTTSWTHLPFCCPNSSPEWSNEKNILWI